MRAIATFLALIAMILFIVSVTMTLHWENVWNDGIGGDWTDGMPLAPVYSHLCFGLSHSTSGLSQPERD